MSEREAALYFINVAKVKVGGFDDGGVKMVSRMMPRLHAGPEGVTIVSSMMREMGLYFFRGNLVPMSWSSVLSCLSSRQWWVYQDFIRCSFHCGSVEGCKWIWC